MAKPVGVEFDGLKQFQAAARRSTDTELPKRLGRAHRHIGELVIAKLEPDPDPAAVGAGQGAAVRASASKREVLLRVGGAHRVSGQYTRMQPWGRRRVLRVGQPAPDRPYIKRTADRHHDEIAHEYLKAISAAADGAFAATDP